MKLCDKIYFLRKSSNLTCEKFALFLGVSRETVYNWETGRFIPNKEKIQKLMEMFNLTYEYLLDDKIDLQNKVIIKKQV